VNREALKALLVKHEGLRLHVYRDSVGIPTIGVGRNLQDRGINEAEAMAMLDRDMTDVIADLDRSIPWWRGLSENRQLVLTDMCFNLGVSRLLGFRNALQAAQEGRWSDAAREMLDSRWAAQVGSRAVELADMMEVG